ncbi:MAG TPA: serine protease [Vicinamibacterales bacterium]|jgi:hypothetical protein|nr:serine protease [Vicinamibacterales bacterium]
MSISRRFAFGISLCAVAASCFTLGVLYTRQHDDLDRASYDVRLEALRSEFRRVMAEESRPTATAGIEGEGGENEQVVKSASRDAMIAEIKEQLQREMGLLPLSLLRDRRSSFVELYSYDNRGQKSYGTAGYLGQGYFITVKHAVVALDGDRDERESGRAGRSIESVKIVFKGKEIVARVVDSGSATAEVDQGDWAIIKTRPLDLPPLQVDPQFNYDFADPIFRLGNDYSKGIVVSTGYVGQKTQNGLVTCLTDGHPGASGGGVLDQRGVLVGIPIGRMQGDYRFSFILPLRLEMLRKVPGVVVAPPNGPSMGPLADNH